MSNQSNKLITYSFLAHINDNNQGIKDLCDLFVPLVKRTLSKMATEGITSGKHIGEIKDRVDLMYSLDIPFPLLSKIIKTIADEIIQSKGSEFIVYKDKAFQINNYTFVEFDDDIAQEELKVSKLESAYITYLEFNGIKPSKENSLYDFIDNNRLQLIEYLSDKPKDIDEKDYTIQAKFINTIKSDDNLYKILCKIYLGSIITSYLEFEPDIPKDSPEKEFLLDTNFIISLLELNAIESVHTCKKIIEICQRLGYRVSVLDLTIQETKNLLERTANELGSSFLQKKLNPESIFNACDVKDFSKTDLEKISDELEQTFKIKILNKHNLRFNKVSKYSKI